MFRTTIKGLLAHKLRLVTTMVSIVLGVALMAGTLMLTDTVTRTFDDLYADINRGTDALVRSNVTVAGSPGQDEQRGTVAASVLDDVRRVDGVAAADGSVQGYAQFVDKAGKAIGNPGQGAPTLGINWPAPDVPNAFQLVAGNAPRAPGEVVMDKASADKGGFAVGDIVHVLTSGEPQDLTVVGIVRFGSVDSPLGASIALFDTATAQQLVGQPGRFDAITVVARDGVDQTQVTDAVRRVLPADAEAITGEALTAENQSQVRKGLQFFSTFLLAFALIAIFVGAFIISNTFSIVVAQRTRELALLRALGASRGQVRRSVLLEATVVGAVASLVGLALGVVMANGLRALLGAVGFDIPSTGTVITAGTAAVALLTGLGVTVASAYLPARRAATIAPIAALRAAALDGAARSRGRLLAGGVVVTAGLAALVGGLVGGAGITAVALGAALVFVGVAVLGPVIARPVSAVLGWPVAALRGEAGRLARANAMRNPKRTSSTASALMIGVALVAFITIFASSTKASVDDTIDRTFRSDVIVNGSAGGGLSPTLAGELARRPEVATATPIRMTSAELAGAPTMLVAVDPDAVERVVDLGVRQGSLADLGPDAVAVSERVSTDEHLAVGDTVQARFTTGERTLRVAAVYADADLVGGHLISLGLVAGVVPQPRDAIVYVSFADGVADAAGRTAVEQVTAAYPTATVQDLTAFKAAQAQPIDQLLSLVYALLLLAVLIALLGIANTLALSVHERTRELGLLRAVGMSRSQVRSTVRWESVIIALLGTALGLGVGLFFGWSMVRALADQGISRLTVPAGPMALLVVLAVLAGIGAAVLPARRAARLDVLGAIASE